MIVYCFNRNCNINISYISSHNSYLIVHKLLKTRYPISSSNITTPTIAPAFSVEEPCAIGMVVVSTGRVVVSMLRLLRIL